MSLFDLNKTNPVTQEFNMLALPDSYEIELQSDNLLFDIENIEIKQRQLIVFTSEKGFDLIDLLTLLLEKIGSCNVTISTYAISELAIRRLFILRQKNLITNLVFLLDKRNVVHKEAALNFLKQFADDVILADNHSKVTVLQNENYNLSIVSSMNYTRNPRIESGVIISSQATANFNQKWITKTR